MIDAKRAIEVLSNQANYSHCPDPPVPTIRLGYKAGKGIADILEKLTRERDAAISDLRIMAGCPTCKHNFKHEEGEEPCATCVKVMDETDVASGWEWRGVCAEDGGRNDTSE